RDGDPVHAERTGTAAAEGAMRLGRPDLAVVALDSVQHNLQRRLRYEAAFEASLRRLELARDAGDLGELGDSYAVTAWNALYLGSFADARAIGREGYELLRADAPLYAVHAHHPRPENLPLLQLAQAELLFDEGRWDELEPLAGEMRCIRELTGATYLGPGADRVEGRAAAASGALDNGLRLLQAAAAGYDAVGMAVDAAVARLDAAEAALAAERTEEAGRLVATARGPLERAGFLAELERA